MNDLSPATVGARKVASGRGASNGALSSQWFTRPADQRFLNLNDLADSVKTRADASREASIPNKQMRFWTPELRTIEDTHQFAIELGHQHLKPTHWSFGQLCTLAGAPASYLRRKPSQLVSDVLHDDFQWRREIEAVKLYHSNDQLHAVTGPDYGRIYDYEVVAAVQQVAGNGIGDTRWKIPGVLDWKTGTYDPNVAPTLGSTTLYASDRDVWVFLCDDRNPIQIGTLPDGSPDYLFRGFYVSNSEVGSGSLRLAAFYLRAVCGNRILWGVENFQEIVMRHTRYAPSRFIEEVRPALNSFAEGATKLLVNGIERAKAARLAEQDDEAVAFLRSRSFSQGRSLAILKRFGTEEQRPMRSAWDMVQGITAEARTIEHTDLRMEMERVATGILEKV